MSGLKIVVIILALIVIGLFLTHDLTSINQDIGRHLKSGEIIWQTKHVYKTNLFSYTESTHPFVNHHWLSEVVFFLLNQIMGLKGLIIFKAVLGSLTFGLLFMAIKNNIRLGPFLISLLIGFSIFVLRSDVRPEIFSYLFLAYFLFAIFKAKYDNKLKYFYTLPFIQLFWTNMHIYFAIGPGLIFLFLLDQLLEKKSKPYLRNLFLIGFLTLSATLINPNFIKGALTPLTILKNYGYSIVENQSIFFLTDYGIFGNQINFFQFTIILLIVSFIIAIKNGRRQIFFELLTALTFTILATKMIRNFNLYALVLIPITALNLSTVNLFKFNIKIRRIGILIVIVILIFGGYGVMNNSLYQWLNIPYYFGTKIAAGAQGGVDFVMKNRIKGPVFNNFDVGSFLIWKLYPQEKVFVDGRPEAYSVDFFEKIYKPMQDDPKIWETYSKQYQINYVFFDYHDITPWARTFLTRISVDRNWPLVYSDKQVLIFLKNTPDNQKIINAFKK